MEALFEGIKSFALHIGGYFVEGLSEWIGVPKEVFSLVGDFNVANVIKFLLYLVGYTWDNLLALVTDAVKPYGQKTQPASKTSGESGCRAVLRCNFRPNDFGSAL